jgi:hypothetical protein
MRAAWICVVVAVLMLGSGKPAVAGRFLFGTAETIHHLQDVGLKGPNSEELYLGYKTSVVNFGAGLYVSDDGYVLGIKGDETRYFQMPAAAALARLQQARLLPDPLPAYKLDVFDYLIGYSLWIILAIVIPFYMLRDRFLARRRAASTTLPSARNEDLAAPPAIQGEHPDDARPGEAVRDIALPVTLYVKRSRMLLYLGLAVIFVVGSVSAIPSRPDIAYLGIVFFGAGAVAFAVQLHPKSAYLHLTADGFVMRNLFRSMPMVAWRDVSRFFTVRMKGATMVAWNYAPGYGEHGAGRAIAKAIAGAESALPDTYGMKPDDLADFMNALRAQCVQGRPS